MPWKAPAPSTPFSRKAIFMDRKDMPAPRNIVMSTLSVLFMFFVILMLRMIIERFKRRNH